MNKYQQAIIKMVVILALLCAGVGMLTRVHKENSQSLQDYADANPDIAYMVHETTIESETAPSETIADDVQGMSNKTGNLTGANLNSSVSPDDITEYSDGFYYAPLSDNLKRYITGTSFPSIDESELEVHYEDLRYVHIWHFDFNGEPVEGELICNVAIAEDLVQIFYELYQNEYQIERVLLVDEYGGDDNLSMEDNNTSCFNYRVVEGSTSLSKHAYGLAIDINPLYNPYITYDKDGKQQVSPESAVSYADRSISFPYKIDEDDLCYKLFKEHGFTWGGDWNSVKDYQHFQKAVKK